MVLTLTLLAVIVLVTVSTALRRRLARRLKPGPARTPLPPDLPFPTLQPERFSLLGGMFFHRFQTWANLLFSGQVKVEVNDFLQKRLGHVDGISLPPVGATVQVVQVRFPWLMRQRPHGITTLYAATPSGHRGRVMLRPALRPPPYSSFFGLRTLRISLEP